MKAGQDSQVDGHYYLFRVVMFVYHTRRLIDIDQNAVSRKLFLFAEVQVQRLVKRNNTGSEEKAQTVVNYATKAGYHEELSKNGAEEQNAKG